MSGIVALHLQREAKFRHNWCVANGMQKLGRCGSGSSDSRNLYTRSLTGPRVPRPTQPPPTHDQALMRALRLWRHGCDLPPCAALAVAAHIPQVPHTPVASVDRASSSWRKSRRADRTGTLRPHTARHRTPPRNPPRSPHRPAPQPRRRAPRGSEALLVHGLHGVRRVLLPRVVPVAKIPIQV